VRTAKKLRAGDCVAGCLWLANLSHDTRLAQLFGGINRHPLSEILKNPDLCGGTGQLNTGTAIRGASKNSPLFEIASVFVCFDHGIFGARPYPSEHPRLTLTFLYSFPSTVLKSSARATDAKQKAKMKKVNAFISTHLWLGQRDVKQQF
jgi:hypothetical protein